MTTILFLLLGVAVIIIIIQATKSKKNLPPDVYTQVTSNPKNEPSLVKEKSTGILDETEYETTVFNLTGAHIGKRKNYILNNCEEYDDVTFKWDKNNKVDDRAIAVYHENSLIGYVGTSDLDELHEAIQSEYSAFISCKDYDGDFLDVEIEVEWVIKKKSKPKRKSQKSTTTDKTVGSNPNISPEDFMIWKANEIDSEYLKPKKDVEDQSSFFYGKKVCISGQLDNFPYRGELAKHLWEKGADVETGVGKTCGILIAGDGVGPSKLKKAEEQGVQIMDEKELIEKLNGFKSKYL